MVDILRHILGGGLIALAGFSTALGTGSMPAGVWVSFFLWGFLREHEQHNGGDFFDFGWITFERLIEALAWGVGGTLVALVPLVR